MTHVLTTQPAPAGVWAPPAAAVIRSIGTAVPAPTLPQDVARDLFRGQPGAGALARRLVGAAFDAAAIDTRHTVLGELVGHDPDPAAVPVFVDAVGGRILEPGTGARNARYVAECSPLALVAARRALEGAHGVEVADVTHIVTVSCTGFSAPGLDIDLVRGLGLSPTTRRLHVGFMGCYGAFPALRSAAAACAAEPDAVVLVVCVELCTLHLRVSEEPDAILANAVFADGAAAAVVTGAPPVARDAPGRDADRAPVGLRIEAMETVLTEAGAAEMTWTIGDLGFEMVLSSYVPRLLEAGIGEALEPLRRARPDLAGPWDGLDWAVHPGGRAILDRVESALALDPTRLAHSREVLRRYGNMSSATVLFVLARLLTEDPGGDRPVCAVAFGPGLTVESALLTRQALA